MKKKKTAVIFGPWVGEFSYELNWWVPAARKVRNAQFPKAHSVALSFIGRRGLYKDFVDEYIEHPRYFQDSLKYPSMTYLVEDGEHVIPKNALKYLEFIIETYKKEFDEVKFVLPGPTHLPPMPNGSVPIPRYVFEEFPDGEYVYLKPDKEIENKVKKKLASYKPKRDWVYVLASARYRDGKLEKKSWPIERYEEFIIKLITDLKVNVVLSGPKGRGNYPGALDSEGKRLQKYKKHILDLVIDEDIVEYQLAILKNTKCSFFNSTGACNLAFFTNTPMFTQHASWYGDRLKFGWQKKLTGGHKNVKIFDKYSVDEIADSPLDETYKEFKEFYKGLN